MVAEDVAQAVVARVTAAFERDQVAARVVVLGVAAIGGFFVMREGVECRFAVDDSFDSVAISVVGVGGDGG